MLALLPSLGALAGHDSNALSTLLRTDLIVAAEATQRTVASLSAQLRAFLDEQTWSEGRRINAAIRKALTAAMDVATDPSRRPSGAESTDLRADINLPLERPLYTPRSESIFDADQQADEIDTDDIESALDELLDLSFIDVQRLRVGVEEVVADHGGIASLSQVLTRYPLNDGLAELVGYLQVAEHGARIVGDDQESVDWTDSEGRHRRADLPLILFEDRDEDLVAEPAASDLERGL